MVDAEGYILRIATKQWVEQVFNMAIYYTSARRKWRPGQTILFMHKTGKGDAVVGYGEIGNLYSIDELSEEEKLECEKHGWKKAIEFTYVKEFENPLSIKDTFLKDLKIRGKYFHGFPLKREQITSIIEQAENR
ncbi:MAG: hypothetical protein QW386_05055 [Candidatus Bathyarchaeia archaeon]